MPYAVDLSNLQRPVTPDDCATLRTGSGITLALFGCQYPGPPYPAGDAHLDFAAARQDGVILCAPYFEDTPVALAWPRIQQFATMPNFVRMGVVAIEDNSGFTDRAMIETQFQALRDRGLQPIAYTSYAMLQKYDLLTAAYQWQQQGVWFWLADYNGQVDLTVTVPAGVTPLPLWAHQYSDDGDAGLGFPVDLSWYTDVDLPSAPRDEDSMADRVLVEGTQDINLLNVVAAKALGPLAAGDQSGGVSAYVRRGPSVDLPATEEELIIRVPSGTIPPVNQ